MLKIRGKQIVLAISDILLLFVALYAALFARFPEHSPLLDTAVHFEIFLPLFVLLVLLYYGFDFYDFMPFQTKFQQLSRLINIHIFVALIGFAYFYLLAPKLVFTPKTILVLYTIFAIIFHVFWRLFLVRSFLKPTKKIATLLIAQNEEYKELKDVVNQHDFYPFYFTDHLVFTEADVDTGSTLETLKKILEENGIEQVIVDIRDQTLTPLLPYLYNLASQRKIDVFDAAKVYQDLLKKMPVGGIGHFWFFESVQLDTHAYEVSKRALDIILAIPWLLAWLILHPFIALAIRLDSKGSIFITQERYGLGGRVMKLYKYRSMEKNDDGKWLKDKDQTNRITRVGAFLRKTSLDEFPQFISILKGDLSFIGPRPDMLPLGGRLSAQIPFYMMRYSIRPGLSGWAQVTQPVIPQTVEDNKVRFQYDLYYIKHRSLLLDLIIVVRTCKALIMRITM